MQTPIKISEISGASKFERELFSIDSRIRFTDMFGGVESNKGFIIRDQVIHFNHVLPSLSHEIGHMVEMRDLTRCVKDDWGMMLPSKANKNPKSFLAAMSREIRVRAIELHILGKSSNHNTKNNILTNPFWDRTAQNFLKKNKLGKFNTYQELQDWVFYLRDKTYAAWSQDRIKHEWEVRFNYISNWMETSSLRVAA